MSALYKMNIHIETTAGLDQILVSMGQFDAKIMGIWLSPGDTNTLIKRLKKALKIAKKDDPDLLTYCDCGTCSW